MYQDREQHIQTVFGVLFSLLFLGFIMFLSTSKLPSQTFALIFILAPIVFLITFINTDVALIILIFSMLLSPELKLAEVPQRAVVVRIDDILLIVVFFSWLAKMAINKQLGLLKHTPLNLPMIAYILVCILSTGIGILLGRINPLKSSFYILKYSEYFMLYFLVTNNIRDKQQIRLFITAFLITGVIICAYATSQIGSLPRVTAPFEGSQAEPNTLGGYLILLFAVCMGLFLYTPSSREKLFSGALAGFIILPFLFTLSRSSYFAFIPMYLTLIIFSKKKKAFLIIILILAVLIAPIILPMGTRLATERVAKTFTPGAIYEPFGRRIPLDDAASARVQSWKRVFGQWMRRPFLGYGVTGVGLVDAQYPRVLGETGIIGFWIFVWLLMAIFRSIVGTINNTDDEWSQGLALGLLAGFIGLLIQALGANTFIIVRIMEPFWFLTAVVMMLPEISKQEQIIKE